LIKRDTGKSIAFVVVAFIIAAVIGAYFKVFKSLLGY
jgi:hypothetical protein